MSKHTPGPWKIVGIFEWKDDQGVRLAQIEYLYVISAIEDRSLLGTVQADARLIAAAPDLLEALEELLGWETHAPQDAIDAARAAVRKATGESNE